MADDCKYALVLQVRVDEVTDTTLTFSSRSSSLELEKFQVSLTEILLGPPTHAPLPVALTSGAVGNLYLSQDGWKVTAKGTGATLYKAGDSNLVLFKWPRCIPYRILDGLRVTPTAIELRGTNVATGAAVAIDLLGSSAAPAQSIHWNGAAALHVELSDAGAQANGGERTMLVWPKHLIVTGASLQKPDRRATVDVLDAFYADFNQRFAWSMPRSPIDLVLSSAGFDEFGVVPGPIVHLAHGFPVSYPKDVAAEIERLKKQDDANLALCKRASANAAK